MVVSGLHSGHVKTVFSTCSSQLFTATRCSKINVSGHFLLTQTFINQVLFEILKKIVLIKFW
jgi:hypothetical protein